MKTLVACFSAICVSAVTYADDNRNPHGARFKVFGNAEMTTDPENRENIVLRVVSTGAPTFAAAGAFRDLRHVQLRHLDHQLSFKRAFVAPNTCDGGSPRMMLVIDADGDGRFEQAPQGPDFVAHGHVRPPYTGCETSVPTGADNQASVSTLVWRFEDLTDEQIRWEVTPAGIAGIGQIGSAAAVNWDGLEAAISAAFPRHRVMQAVLIEDFNATAGVAYYDLVTVLDLTLGTKGQEKAPERGGGNDED